LSIKNYYSNFLKLHITILQVYFSDVGFVVIEPTVIANVFVILFFQAHFYAHGRPGNEIYGCGRL